MELTTEGFGFEPERLWVTVFGGDEELGLGPDDEAIEIWKGVGMSEERIVPLPRSENFWQAGPTGPCGPCSELYYDRGEQHGEPGDAVGGDTDRFIEFWNHVFMTYDLSADGGLTPLPMQNIDTGHGPGADGDAAAGRGLRLRDRPSGPAGQAGRRALGTRL